MLSDRLFSKDKTHLYGYHKVPVPNEQVLEILPIGYLISK